MEEELGLTEKDIKGFSIEEVRKLEMPYTAKYVMEHYLEKGRYTAEMYVGVANGEKVEFVHFPEF
jgi:8-oxo-dGTP diphosphatase